MPQLWKRFTIGLRRLVAKTLGVPATRLDEVATVQYAKVAEYQLRGLVHFHALIRLDGPKTPDGFAPAPTSLDASILADLVRRAANTVRLTVPGVDEHDPARTLAFGAQLDTRPVRLSRRTDDPDRSLTPGQVAGYLAKYATKSATDSGDSDSPHHRRIRGTARQLADRAANAAAKDGVPAAEAPYTKLGDWVHMLGFRGHFGTKSRRYSITYTALRRARQRAQALIAQHRAEGRPLDLAALEADLLADEQDETTLVIGHWTYVGTGWNTDAQTVLANAAAARAREYDQWKAQRKKKPNRREVNGMSDRESNVDLTRKWFTVAEVAQLLGYGETKVRMLIVQGDLKSLKDGRSRRVLPQWVDEYVAMRAEQAERGVA